MGAKIVYSQGFRPPDAVALFSTVGTQGNADLEPEVSRSFAVDATLRALSPISIRAGGSWARVANLIILDPQAADPGFWYKAVNAQEHIDILAAYGEGRLSLSTLEVFANYSYKQLAESAPQNIGIPVAPHTAAFGLNLRPLEDFHIYLLGSYSSMRSIWALQAGGAGKEDTVPGGVVLSAGFGVASLLTDGLNLEVNANNPFGLPHYTPYKLDGTINPLVETRSGRELTVTIRWAP